MPSINELILVIEGIIFSSTVPLSVEAIYKFFLEEEKPSKSDIKKVLDELSKMYQNRGIVLVEVASGYRFQVAPEVVPYVKTLQDKPTKYSRALLETLALIAYRQPITRGEIEDIRGVVVSSQIMRTLEEHHWVRTVGHKEVPGKPALYATTKTFLDYFGLKSLDELPPLVALSDFESLVQESAAIAIAQDEAASCLEQELVDQEELEEMALEEALEQ